MTPAELVLRTVIRAVIDDERMPQATRAKVSANRDQIVSDVMATRPVTGRDLINQFNSALNHYGA